MIQFSGSPHRNRFLLMAIATGFFYYLFGFQILNPFFTEWMVWNDGTVHLGGVNYFLHEPWQWPIGKISHYSYPLGTSLAFTDSIPIISIVLKALNIVPSAPIQFQGIWIYLCFILQALLGYELIHRFGREHHSSKWNAFFGALIFLIFPAFLFRTFENTRHYTLLAHFFVMFMLLRLESDLRLKQVSRLFWLLVVLLSIGIHLYFAAFAALFWFSLELQNSRNLDEVKNSKNIALLIAIGAITFFIAEAFGYFVIEPGHAAKEGGFGSFSMNFFSWLNSEGFSNLFTKLPTRSYEQREGVAYLGLGIISLILLLFSQAKVRRNIKQEFFAFFWSPVGVLFLFIFLFSLSPRITILGFTIPDGAGYGIYAIIFYQVFKKLFKGEHPEAKAIALVCATLLFYFYFGKAFRSSGRFSWCLSYALVAYLLRFPNVRWVLPAVLVVQLADIAPLIQSVRKENYKIYSETSKLQTISVAMDELFKNISQIKILKPEDVDRQTLTYFAMKNHIPAGPLYKARRNAKEEARLEEETKANLLNGKFEDQTLYVIGDPQLFQKMPSQMKLEVAGFRVLKTKKADQTE